MPIVIKEQMVLLCEGPADCSFFRNLGKKHECLPFDTPFPHSGERLVGKDAFKDMLKSVRGTGLSYQNLKAILIAVDSRSDHENTFNEVCERHIREVGNFCIPTDDGEIAFGDDGHPAIGILLVPGKRPGALETLCIEAIEEKYERGNELITCVDSYMRCGPIDIRDWSAEKRDKARLRCLVAALNQTDPIKSEKFAFESVIPTDAEAFNDIGLRLKSFCDEVARL